jgi:hypothetical protein
MSMCACMCALARVRSREFFAPKYGIFQGKCKYRWSFGRNRALARSDVGIPDICLYSAVGCLWGNCGGAFLRNPRRRHRDFRRADSSASLSPPFSTPPLRTRSGDWCSQVGWVKADTKAIQAIHDHVITHNPRVAVTHSDHTMWNLHIKGVQIEDAGLYMCQINTDPMKSQVCNPLGPISMWINIDPSTRLCDIVNNDKFNGQSCFFSPTIHVLLIRFISHMVNVPPFRKCSTFRSVDCCGFDLFAIYGLSMHRANQRPIPKVFPTRASITKFLSFIRIGWDVRFGRGASSRAHVAINTGRRVNLTRCKFCERSRAWRKRRHRNGGSIVRKFRRESGGGRGHASNSSSPF